MNSNMYPLNNFDFLIHNFARVQAEGHLIDIQVITGDMDEEHRSRLCRRYTLYCRRVMEARELELEH